MTLKFVVIRGDSRQVSNIITDYDQTTPLEPESHIIKLLKPDGTQQGDNMITPSGSGGTYTQEITVPIDGVVGEWSIEWQIFVGIGENAPRSTDRIRFRVVD